jgi:hypothetical protein
MEIIAVLVLVIFVLFVLNVFLIWKFYGTDKKINSLLEDGEIKDYKDLKRKVDEVYNTAIKKIGVVRYNPFNEIGGNQSFVVAMLDGKNNGFVISSLFAKEGTRIFTKTVKSGKSEYALSKEEVEAVQKAINEDPYGKKRNKTKQKSE